MKKMLFLFWFLFIQNTSFSEDYGIFKANWNTVPVNQLMSVSYYVKADKENLNKNENPYVVDGGKSAQVLIRSISFKFINSEFENWKAALKGEKIYYCAVRVDVDWQGAPTQATGGVSLKFFDRDGLKVSPGLYMRSDTFIELSQDDMETKDLSFYSDKSRGAPVRFEIQ